MAERSNESLRSDEAGRSPRLNNYSTTGASAGVGVAVRTIRR
jgi:hypothetical protein